MKAKKQKCKLSVNINKIATLRNSRGGHTPNLIECARDIIDFGAEGITVHPRPDERHIKKADVYALKELLNRINRKRKNNKIEFNIEGYPSQDFLDLLKDIRPDQATLVPDPPNVITSNAGWRVAHTTQFLKDILGEIHALKVRSSLFIDVFDWRQEDQLALCEIGPDRVELYTERFAKDYPGKNRAQTTKRYKDVATAIAKQNIAINAGHDLNLQNVRYLLKTVPEIIECSIGHALISESLYMGFKKTIGAYRKEMRLARKANPTGR